MSHLKSDIMKRFIIFISGILLMGILLVSCKDDPQDNPDPVTYLKIAEAQSANSSYTVEMCAHDSLFVGYNKLYFRLLNKNDGSVVTNASLNLRPIMDMGTFKHACPLENPPGTANSNGYFEGAILFSMPGTDSWSVDVDIVAGSVTDSVHFPLGKVVGTTPARKIVVIDSLETAPGVWKITKYPMSLVLQDSWKVGLNTFEFTIHKMENMMSFPAVTDMIVEIEPEMPSMGHGSTNNVNPVHTSNGHYAGTVNFTMTGDWRVHLKLSRDGRLISDKAYFDIYF